MSLMAFVLKNISYQLQLFIRGFFHVYLCTVGHWSSRAAIQSLLQILALAHLFLFNIHRDHLWFILQLS